MSETIFPADGGGLRRRVAGGRVVVATNDEGESDLGDFEVVTAPPESDELLIDVSFSAARASEHPPPPPPPCGAAIMTNGCAPCRRGITLACRPAVPVPRHPLSQLLSSAPALFSLPLPPPTNHLRICWSQDSHQADAAGRQPTWTEPDDEQQDEAEAEVGATDVPAAEVGGDPRGNRFCRICCKPPTQPTIFDIFLTWA